MGFSLAKWIIREKHCVCRALSSPSRLPPPRQVACHVTTRARGPLRDSTEDRRIGLNMNYSIIFTEISFSPETSILIQIIQIIHMTLGIIPESDRKGRAVCQSWLQGGKHNVTPTDKNQPFFTNISVKKPLNFLQGKNCASSKDGAEKGVG